MALITAIPFSKNQIFAPKLFITDIVGTLRLTLLPPNALIIRRPKESAIQLLRLVGNNYSGKIK